MATDKLVKNLIINKMTKAQYQSIEPSDTELYFIIDEEPGGSSTDQFYTKAEIDEMIGNIEDLLKEI